MQGKLVIFSAPSGSGKTTIVRHLLSFDLHLEFSISATSREPREGEINGKDYYFLSSEEFRNRIDKMEFLEWEEVYPGQYYGTLISEVNRIHNNGKHVVFDIDVIGGLKLKKKYGKHALAIFVKAPSLEIMEQRLKKRNTDSEEQLHKRITKAKEETAYADQFDVILINDDLSTVFKEAEQIVGDFLLKD